MSTAILALTPRSSAEPTVLYAAPDLQGTEGAPGTREQPLTLRVAVSRVGESPEGGRVILRGGRYFPTAAITIGPVAKGVAATAVIIEAADGESPIIDGSWSAASWSADNSAKEKAAALPGAPGVFILHGWFERPQPTEMFALTPPRRFRPVASVDTVRAVVGTCALIDKRDLAYHLPDGTTPAEINLRFGFHGTGVSVQRPNVTLRGIRFDNFVRDVWSNGVDLRADDCAVEKCRFFNCIIGVSLLDHIKRPRVANCRLDQCDTGIGCYADGAVIQGNQIVKVRDNSSRDNTYVQEDSAIYVYHPAQNTTVRGNLTEGYKVGLFIKADDTPMTVEHNTFFDGMVGNKNYPMMTVRKNVINIDPRWADASLPDHPERVAPSARLEGNLFFTEQEVAARARAKPVTIENGEGNLRGSPEFVDPCGSDLRVRAKSPADTLGDSAGPAGALPVAAEAPATDPADWTVTVDAPAVAVERDSPLAMQLTGASDLRKSYVDVFSGHESPALILTSQRAVQLKIIPSCGPADVKPAKVHVALDDAKPASLPKDKLVTLAANHSPQRLDIEIEGMGGRNTKKTLTLVWFDQPAKVLGSPQVRFGAGGAIVTFRTDQPAGAEMAFEPDGKIVAGRADVSRIWNIESGKETVTAVPRQNFDHAVFVPAERSGHDPLLRFRIRLNDALKRQSTSESYAIAAPAKASDPMRLHVAPQGQDAPDRGAADRPLATIQYAVDRALPGDTIHLAPGVYFQTVRIGRGGSAEKPLLIEGDDARSTALDGLRLATNLIQIDDASYVHIRRLGVRWFQHCGIYARSSSDLQVEECRFINSVWVGWPTGYGVMLNESPRAVLTSNIASRTEYGLFIYNSPGTRIEHNTAAGNLYAGVGVFNSLRGLVMRGNAFCFNTSAQVRIEQPDRPKLAQMKEAFQAATIDFNNYATRVGPATLEKFGGRSIRPSQDYLAGESKYALVVSSNDGVNDMDKWRAATGQDAHSIFEDPKFVEPWLDHWEVEPSSPNLEAGKNGTTIGALGALP